MRLRRLYYIDIITPRLFIITRATMTYYAIAIF